MSGGEDAGVAAFEDLLARLTDSPDRTDRLVAVALSLCRDAVMACREENRETRAMLDALVVQVNCLAEALEEGGVIKRVRIGEADPRGIFQ